MPHLRWLIDSAGDGAANMACDEMLLWRVGRRTSPPTLRFYRWSPATISLGYFQPYADFVSLDPPAGKLPVVRRQTGGGAILHDLELTYSLTLPLEHPLLADGRPNHLYDHVHRAFADLLIARGIPVETGPPGRAGCSHRGPFFCFERHSPFDLLADGRKLMGSAQRRTTSAVLQHGSLILDSRHKQQRCAAVREFADLDIDTMLPEIACRIAGQTVGEPEPLHDQEVALARQLLDKYRSTEWTQRR